MNPDLLPQALSAYAIKPLRSDLLQSDRQIVFHLVAARGREYALRIYPPGQRDRRTIWSQCQWLRAIARDTDLLVPEPIPNRDGDDVTPLNGGWCTLTRWVPGRRRFWKNGPGADVLRNVGYLMARLHEHGQSFKPPPGFRCPRWDWHGLFGTTSPWYPQRKLALDKPTRQLFDRIMRRTRAIMQNLGTGQHVFGLIHGDLMQANYVVDRGHVHPIDFADFGRGYFLYDMAVTLLMLKPFDQRATQRHAFIQGYRQVRPVSPEHESLLDDFLAARAVLLARLALGAAEPRASDLQWVNQTLPWLVVGA